jgi:hypothetical protein
MAVIPEERGAFGNNFGRQARIRTGGAVISFVRLQLWSSQKPLDVSRSAADMFPGSRMESEFLNKFYIMDVILNWESLPAVTGDNKKGKTDYGKSTKVDYDVVCPFVSYEPKHLGPEMDYLYRAAILFLPRCGAFYCHRERCRGDVGMPGTDGSRHELAPPSEGRVCSGAHKL